MSPLFAKRRSRPRRASRWSRAKPGAGKTALLSAIKLLVGERADASTVREGAQGAVVEGRFFLPADADNADDGHIACRKVSADGRSRVSIDGSMSTVRQLAEQLGATVDLCGQHEHQHLLKPTNHAAMLDAWAGDAVASAKAAYIEAFNAEQAAAAELAAFAKPRRPPPRSSKRRASRSPASMR